MNDVRLAETRHLSARELRAIRHLLDEAFEGDFTDDDWQHALGGWHAVIGSADAGSEDPALRWLAVVAHAAVVERRIAIDAQDFRAGYVEAVAVAPVLQRTGLGLAVMAAITDLIRRTFDLGVLSSGERGFYERLGWERWRGPTFVRAADGHDRRTPDDDDGVMVLRCEPTRDIDLRSAITCEERAGDSW